MAMAMYDSVLLCRRTASTSCQPFVHHLYILEVLNVRNTKQIIHDFDQYYKIHPRSSRVLVTSGATVAF